MMHAMSAPPHLRELQHKNVAAFTEDLVDFVLAATYATSGEHG